MARVLLLAQALALVLIAEVARADPAGDSCRSSHAAKKYPGFISICDTADVVRRLLAKPWTAESGKALNAALRAGAARNGMYGLAVAFSPEAIRKYGITKAPLYAPYCHQPVGAPKGVKPSDIVCIDIADRTKGGYDYINPAAPQASWYTGVKDSGENRNRLSGAYFDRGGGNTWLNTGSVALAGPDGKMAAVIRADFRVPAPIRPNPQASQDKSCTDSLAVTLYPGARLACDTAALVKRLLEKPWTAESNKTLWTAVRAVALVPGVYGQAVAFSPDAIRKYSITKARLYGVYCHEPPAKPNSVDPADMQCVDLGSMKGYDYTDPNSTVTFWYRMVKDGGPPKLSGIYFDQGGGNIWMETVSVPVMGKDGKLAAVVTVDMRASAPAASIPPSTDRSCTKSPAVQKYPQAVAACDTAGVVKGLLTKPWDEASSATLATTVRLAATLPGIYGQVVAFTPEAIKKYKITSKRLLAVYCHEPPVPPKEMTFEDIDCNDITSMKEGYDYTNPAGPQTVWYTKVVAAGGGPPRLSGVYFDKGGGNIRMESVSVPVLGPDGKLAAVVAVDIRMSPAAAGVAERG